MRLAALRRFARSPVPSRLLAARSARGSSASRDVRMVALGPAKAVTGVAATDVFTSTAHGYTAGQAVAFCGLTGGAGLTAGRPYFVRDVAANTFKVAAAPGGAAVDFTSDLSAGTVRLLG